MQTIQTLPIPTIISQFDAVKFFIQRLDIEMVDLILKEELTYQDLEKKEFVKRLSLVFEEFISAGDQYLNVINSTCRSCNKGKVTYLFVGNISKNYICMYFDEQDGDIKDIYECNWFGHMYIHKELKRKLCIHKSKLPF
jgi:hypothetical protein